MVAGARAFLVSCALGGQGMSDYTAADAQGPLSRADVSHVILSSWNRCLRSGLDPRETPEDAMVSARDLRNARETRARLLKIVRPELEMLGSQIAGTNHMVAFADETGLVLDCIMDPEFQAADCAKSVQPGSIWLEEIRGTNALGLALVTGRSSVVTGGEHFFGCHAGVSCVSVPILASDGRIVGLLDASSEIADRQAHTSALVNLAAITIENRLFAETHRQDHVLRFHPRAEFLETQGVGMIALDGDGRITGANRMAGRLLSGLSLDRTTGFAELFRDDFRAAIRRPGQGDVTLLADLTGARYFSRLRPAAMPGPARRPDQIAGLQAPAIYRIDPTGEDFVLDDELLRASLRVARRAARVGQPVCIRGAKGSGRTGFAEVIHRSVQHGKPLIAVDCGQVSRGGDGMSVSPGEVSIAAGGTLVLEDIPAMGDSPPEGLIQVIERLRAHLRSGHWTLLGTSGSADPLADVTLGRMQFLPVDLPPLADRTDFEKLARNMLADLSPQHRLSAGAVRTLARMDRPGNLHDLRHHLQLLVARCPGGILRDRDLIRLLHDHDDDGGTCAGCRGTPMREQRCREIRRMHRLCQGNVALTARRLGVARNTVYAHIRV